MMTATLKDGQKVRYVGPAVLFHGQVGTFGMQPVFDIYSGDAIGKAPMFLTDKDGTFCEMDELEAI